MLRGHTKRGQTATEYLIILAVVIIIALVAVTVLGGFPTLFTSQSSQTLSEAYWQSAQISVYQHRISGDVGTFYFRNKMQFPIQVHEIRLNELRLAEASDKVIPSGGILKIVEDTAGEDPRFACTKGQPYAYWVTIRYSFADTGEGPFEFTGLRQLIGTCQ